MNTSRKEGALRKWTNYWNGWQSRWFVLEDGTLSYYTAQDTQAQGCKGQINISDASISAHALDPCRLDVVIADDQHLQLKAGSPHERHEWLVALGSLKTTINTHKANQLLLNGDCEMPRKCAELRVYADLLIQQVNSIKAAVVESPIPDVQKLDESTSLLGETCDTFVQTVRECLSMALHTSHSPNLHNNNHHSHDSDVDCTAACSAPANSLKQNSLERRVASAHNKSTDSADFVLAREIRRSQSESESMRHSTEPADQGHVTPSTAHTHMQIQTIFASHDISFLTIVLADDGGLDTNDFLGACVSLTKIFDILGSTAFAPVKMDLNGNIRKLRKHHEVNPDRFSTMQSLVLFEVHNGSTTNAGSATDALLWLKRGISFVREFLVHFEQTDDLVQCANVAYAKTLKRHHAWIVRGIFSMATAALPSRETFLAALYPNHDLSHLDTQTLRQVTRSELVGYVAGIDRCMRQLDNLYTLHQLDPDLTITTQKK